MARTLEELRDAWLKVVEIYNKNGCVPTSDVDEIIAALGMETAVEVFATVSAIKKYDGRIYGANRDFMNSIPVNPEALVWNHSNPMLRAKLDDIHTAHINAMISVLRFRYNDWIKNQKKKFMATVEIDHMTGAFVKNLLSLTGSEIYDVYGLKEDETFVRSVKFEDGVEADVKLVICGESDNPYTEMVLFRDGRELCHTDPDEEYFGDWSVEYDGVAYEVLVMKE